MINYLVNLAIALDQLLNAAIAGWADEMLSSRAYRRRMEGSKFWGIIEKVINFVFFFQPAHCLQAYLFEKSKLNFPVELR